MRTLIDFQNLPFNKLQKEFIREANIKYVNWLKRSECLHSRCLLYLTGLTCKPLSFDDSGTFLVCYDMHDYKLMEHYQSFLKEKLAAEPKNN